VLFWIDVWARGERAALGESGWFGWRRGHEPARLRTRVEGIHVKWVDIQYSRARRACAVSVQIVCSCTSNSFSVFGFVNLRAQSSVCVLYGFTEYTCDAEDQSNDT
jgi:hypothetical protein